MTITPIHTFVIPAYGESEYLEECILSLIKQSIKSKIIITTSTPSAFLDKISKKYNLTVFLNKNSSGIASDWTFGCKSCNTKYLTIAHQDDIYLPDYTKKNLAAVKHAKNDLITFSNYKELYNKVPRTNTPLLIIKRIMLIPFFLLNNRLSIIPFKKAMLAAGSSICCPGVMFNKKNIGNIFFNNNMSINMDWDFWWNLAKRKGDFIFVKDKLMIHRIHPDSATNKGLINNKRQSEDRLMFNKIWPEPIAGILTILYSLSYFST